jgi:hypothetical protein
VQALRARPPAPFGRPYEALLGMSKAEARIAEALIEQLEGYRRLNAKRRR